MNGRRLDSKTYITAYQLCKYRDGERCAICGGHIGNPMPPKLIGKWKLPTDKIESLEIDHIDGNPLNNPADGTNWRLLCKADNLEAWCESGGVVSVCVSERDVVRKQTKASIEKVKEGRRQVKVEADREEMSREKKELRPSTSVVKQQVSYRDGESTMQANAFLQSAWGKWLVNQLNERGFMPRKEAKFSGAYVTGGSPITIERYLETALSPAGPIEKFTDEAGEVLIRWKPRFREDETQQ
jgi:hypothetical protein